LEDLHKTKSFGQIESEVVW